MFVLLLCVWPHLEFLFGFYVPDGGEVEVLLELENHEVLLGPTLSRSHEHHPVTAVLIVRVHELKPRLLLHLKLGR